MVPVLSTLQKSYLKCCGAEYIFLLKKDYIFSEIILLTFSVPAVSLDFHGEIQQSTYILVYISKFEVHIIVLGS
jgi:hypothetical protein